ncbi:hypothetical protein [Streptomyces aureus]|uniref:hypothetical protein n=1 Tax=Streptomyces aureus TaxID=193461 RepID=UPI0036CDC9B8
MLRFILIALLGLYLIVVGLWPAAAAPVSLMAAGLAVVFGLIPTPVWLITAGIAWARHQPSPVPAATPVDA